MKKIFKKFFGSRNDRLLSDYSKIVEEINDYEDGLKELSNEEILAKTTELKAKFKEHNDLDQILPEAFAVVREASVRTLGLRHYDAQMIGGITLHQGKIAEMKTGEGKTLVSTLPSYLNAISGESVHIITVNEYLAGRDAEWMSPIYEFLGLTVGCIKADQNPRERKESYECDITYGTNNEFGFDYLRDNLAFEKENQSQGSLGFAIVDEVDSILIDEARTPLIISGRSEQSTDLYQKINLLVPKLQAAIDEEDTKDYTVDEKTKQIYLTELGHTNVEKILNEMGLIEIGESLYDPQIFV